MTSEHGPLATAAAPDPGSTGGTGSTAGTGDTVLGAFGGLGAPLDCAGLRNVPLEGPQVLWLVVAGAMDLFAVDAAGHERWHYLGRLEAGTLLLGPVEGPRHTLVSRPLQGCVLRRIPLRELVRPAPQPYELGYEQPQPYGQQQPYGQGPYDSGYGQGSAGSDPSTGQLPVPQGAFNPPRAEPSPLEVAFSQGVGRGLRVLFEARVDGRPAVEHPTADDDILWMPVEPGTVEYGAAFDVAAAADLLVDGEMWQRMVNQQSRLLLSLGRWIERLERSHEERAAAGVRAGEAAGARADETLLASIGPSGRGGSQARAAARGGDDAALAVCRLVGHAAGIAVSAPTGPGAGATDRLDPVERIAIASGFRTREVALGGRWWRENSGPLVGRLAES